MEVVTADGRVVRAASDENPDLFWGLRGGGGNFGVVTGIDYALYPVGPEVVGGVVAWPASEAPQVLDLYRRLAAEAPPELTLVALLRPAPPAPWLPKEMHGQPMVALLACHTGPPEEGERSVAAIKDFGKPVGDILVRRPYAQMQALLDATQPKGRRYYWKSEYLPGIEPALCEQAIEQAAQICSPHSAVIFFQIEGRPQPGRGRALTGRQPRCPLRAQCRRLLGAGGGRRREHRLGARRLGRHEGLLDRRQLRQLPHRGRRP